MGCDAFVAVVGVGLDSNGCDPRRICLKGLFKIFVKIP